jgi:DNA-binding MurR/RpiR family transcriptional regulator
MYLFQKIEEQSVHYHDARKNIGEFLLNERTHAGNFDMKEIAHMTFTSKPTLTRFAQGMGYTGWITFMEDFLKEAKYIETHFSEVDANMPFNQSDNIEEIVHKLCILQKEAIQETADLIEYTDIEKACSRIMNAKFVYTFGISPNSILSDLFCRKMESIGILVKNAFSDESGMISHALKSDDCAIIISYSGNNTDRIPTKYVPKLKENHVPMIAITSQGDNYLRNNIDICLTISSREKLYSKIANYSTEESINFIFNVIFSQCFAMSYKQNYEYKVINAEELESNRMASMNEMKEDDTYPYNQK